MKITVKQTNINEVVYSRLIDNDAKKLGDILGQLMSQPAGTAFEVSVESGSHSHRFPLSAEFDLKALILKVEGVTKRASPTRTTSTTTAT